MTASVATQMSSPPVILRRWTWWFLAIIAATATAFVARMAIRPSPMDFTRFDAAAMGRLESASWRAYYEQRPLRLLGLLEHTMRVQFHTGHAGAIPLAWRATRAAFAFKGGTSRTDYATALPPLERYFERISAMSVQPFDAKAAARQELEWWIIRRERDTHTTAEWETLIAGVASLVYHVPVPAVRDYARLRVEAMVLRDARGSAITEADWARISALLVDAWTSLGRAVAAGS